ncbi:hypothetical protein ACIBEF_00700 [Micromonospora sp. NPDC050795]|uniref:hypothetical protein n=1 Tax=Micromonospora sp. NPDC050795 TaxID=3364282 RepID=UPI003796D238
MTHPPSGPHTPTAPSGPRERIAPVDPDSAAGQAAADSLSQALAEIYLAIARRRSDRAASADAA